jgi:hypothetical protein
MPIAERLDEYGKVAWIGLTILGFWLCWPLGVATLIFLACSGRIRVHGRSARWRGCDDLRK